MSENHSGTRRRARRSERAQRFYAARETNPLDESDALSQEEGYAPEDYGQPQEERFAPDGNAARLPDDPDGGASSSAAPYARDAQTPDFSAYYRRGSTEGDELGQPAFAPPPKMNLFYDVEEETQTDEKQEAGWGNVYRPREATWADTARHDVLNAGSIGYQVREEAASKKGKGKGRRGALITLAAVVLLLAAAWLLREPLTGLIGQLTGGTEPADAPFEAVTTPEPVKAYDAAPGVELAESARAAISELSGTLNMEAYAVTDSHVITRNLRPDGLYDFYLFTAAEGRLLCYFEGLGPLDMIPQEGGTFYVKQSPWLVAPNGSALIRTTELETTLGESLVLHPLQHGWTVLEAQQSGSANYINTSGQLISTLWFSKAFPFTGDYTAAYVDTGATADPDQRYLLYVLGTDGMMSRWLVAGDMNGLVASAAGMAYMQTGELYRLPDTSAPLAVTDHVDAYLDCDAMVIRDPESGKYGLFVHGEQHYDFAYDSIAPVESDIKWGEKTLSGNGGDFVVHAVEGASYPQPLAYSFVLEREGQCEYVALSAHSSYPIRLEDEF